MNREVHVRFWESAGLKCSALLDYLHAYATGGEARLGIGRWIDGYNRRRPHQALGYRTPDEVYWSASHSLGPAVAEVAA
jgi:putative transposase